LLIFLFIEPLDDCGVKEFTNLRAAQNKNLQENLLKAIIY